MTDARPTAILLLGERGRATEEAERCASEVLRVILASRAERDQNAVDPAVRAAASEGVDWILSFLSPVILPSDVLAGARQGAVNVHPAPPEWPGIGSASYALYAGDRTFGVTAHLMTEVVDGGPIVRVDRFPIEEGDTCDDVFDRAIERSVAVFRDLVAAIGRGERPVPNGVAWARKASTRREFERWMTLRPTDPPDEVSRKVRALRSARFPGPFVELGGRRFEIPASPRPPRPRTSLPWWEPRMTGRELGAVREVIDANFLNDGDVTTRFEQSIARRAGARHAICVTSGTAAIFCALKALGIGPGDEVIVPDVTFIASANAAQLTGATVVLVDVDPATLTVDPGAVRAAIGPRTRAIMPVHVSGRAAAMDDLLDIARRHGVAIVEDAAEAFTSLWRGRGLGTIGSAGALSFSPNKTITTGQGGAVLTNDDAVAQCVREIKDQGRPVRGTGGDDLHPSIGYNFKFTNLQAAVGLAQLRALDERIARQRRVQRIYREELAGVSEVRLLPFDLDAGEVPQWTDAIVERRDELDRHLASSGAGCRRFWLPLHSQAPYRTRADAYPTSSALLPQAIWLPSAFTLSDDDVRRVSGLIRSFYGRPR